MTKKAEAGTLAGLREKFEQWAESQGLSVTTFRFPPDTPSRYTYDTEFAWKVWQAASESTQAPPETKVLMRKGPVGQEVAAIAYQILGVMGAPVRILDYFSAIASGKSAKNPLPFSPDELQPSLTEQQKERWARLATEIVFSEIDNNGEWMSTQGAAIERVLAILQDDSK